MTGRFAFGRFVLDAQDRRLEAGGRSIDLNARYFDALTLLVRSPGQLVSKERFLAEVWRGVPVTDEALTQCIKTLRRQLGDDAGRPQFIETVPKHGYRFVADVAEIGAKPHGGASESRSAASRWSQFVVTSSAGVLGGGLAGIIGGLVYGFAGASAPAEAGMGTISIMLVLLCLTVLVALIGSAGVSIGIATAAFARPTSWQWAVIGGAAGGMLVGAFGKLLGLDAFTLIVGHSPGDITGGAEGMALGAAVGMGAWLARRSGSIRQGAALAAGCGAVAGLAISLLGGRLMLGSLEILSEGFPQSRLRLDQVAEAFGKVGLLALTPFVSAALEGALFAACIVGAIMVGGRRLRDPRSS